MAFSPQIIRLSLIGLLTGITACGWFPHKNTHHAHNAGKTHYHAEVYLQHLALARLTADPAQQDLDAIDAYARQKGKPEQQIVVMLQYKSSGSKSLREIAAPLSSPPRFRALLPVIQRMDHVTLHNLHLVVVTVAPAEALKLPDDMDSDDLDAALAQEQQRLTENAGILPPLEDARKQLQLIRFFMQHRCRDAAYLAAGNVKLLLASIKDNAETVKSLSQELESLEGDLHRTLPFTL